MLNAVREELLDYTSFVSIIKGKIAERMGQGYQVKIFKVIKNNSLELDSLAVLKEGRNYSPNIYLNAYYDSYLTGTPVTEIVERLYMIYENCTVPIVKENFEYTLELMRPYIFFRLVSLERNKKLLKQVPYVEYLDLAITFHCLVRSEAEEIGSIRITNDHIKQWNIGCDKLMELAIKNTKKLFPPVIRTMEEVIRELIYKDEGNEMLDLGDSGYNIYPRGCNTNQMECNTNQMECGTYPMYILTNEKGINGASCLIYKDLIKEFAQRIKSDLYILPSSIHEIILVPNEGNEDKERFQQMVMDINSSQVPAEEVLSDRVYMYSLKMDTILM